MNSNRNVQATSRQKTKQILCAGLHPEGGFVALPGGRSTRITHDPDKPWNKKGNRKGFVAWPVKE
jgi:hypothetical protein